MAQAVIDQLEAIDVHQQHGQGLSGCGGSHPFSTDARVEAAAVGQLRQHIKQGQPTGALALEGMEQQAEQAAHRLDPLHLPGREARPSREADGEHRNRDSAGSEPQPEIVGAAGLKQLLQEGEPPGAHVREVSPEEPAAADDVMQHALPMLGSLEEVPLHAQRLHLTGAMQMPDVLAAIHLLLVRQKGQGQPQHLQPPGGQLLDEQQHQLIETAQAGPVLQHVALKRHRHRDRPGGGDRAGRRSQRRLQLSVGFDDLGLQPGQALELQPGTLPEKGNELLPGHRPGDQISLQRIDPQPQQHLQIAMLLHPFGHHGLAETVHRLDQRPHKALQAVGATDPIHQLQVQLDAVVPGLAETPVIGEAGAEVVDDQPKLELIHQPLGRGAQAVGLLHGLHGGGLGELEPKQGRVDALAAQQGHQRVLPLGGGHGGRADVHRDVDDAG